MAVKEKTLIETVDMTPTWTELVPLLNDMLVGGISARREDALKELRRMAQAADGYNKIMKGLVTADERGEIIKKLNPRSQSVITGGRRGK